MDPPPQEKPLSNWWCCSCFQTSHNWGWSARWNTAKKTWEKKSTSLTLDLWLQTHRVFKKKRWWAITLSPVCVSQILTLVAGSPGGSETGCCGSEEPPEPTRWCSRWCSRRAGGSSLPCSWSGHRWKDSKRDRRLVRVDVVGVLIQHDETYNLENLALIVFVLRRRLRLLPDTEHTFILKVKQVYFQKCHYRGIFF